MRKKAGSYCALAGSMVLAGSSVIVGKLLVQKLPVFLTAALSLLIALAVLVPVCLYVYGFKLKLTYKTVFIFFLQAFTGTFLFRTLLFFGLNRTSASTGGLITSSAPAMVTLMAFVILREKLVWNKVLGVILTVIGIGIINTMSSTVGGPDTLMGNLLVFLAVVGEALFSILSKLTDNKIPPMMKTTLVCFFALVCFIPFSIYDLVKIEFLQIDCKTWLCLIYYGLFITVLAFILWFKGISDTPASTSAVFSGFMPISSITLASLMLHEKISLHHIISLTLIILGLITTLKPSLYGKLLSIKIQPKQSL